MVAGGGSGGLNIAGGGGAGAVLESPSSGFTFPNNTYTITIGGGGIGQSFNRTRYALRQMIQQ